MNELPLLSIITVTKNDRSGFETTRASVERFIGESQLIEWIVINAGSKFEKTSFSLKRFHILTEEDSGPFAGMNKGLKLATGVHVNFLNSGDEILHSLRREMLLEALQSSESSWAVAKAQKEIVGGVENWKIPKRCSMKLWLGVNSFPHQSTFYSAQELRSFKGFNEFNLAADYEISLRFLRQSVPDYYNFYYSRNSMGGISDGTDAYQQARYISEVHRNVFQVNRIVSFFDFLMIYLLKKMLGCKRKR
jgi:hypothetical protein